MATKPSSKIVHMITVNPEHKILVLCDDGSIWWLDVNNGNFTLLVQMSGKTY